MAIKFDALKIFSEKKQLEIFILGIYSGMPLYVIYSTLAAWLKTENISLEIITSIAIARIFYSLKLFWAPFVDHVQLPYIHYIGLRKSWMIFMICLITIVMFSYSYLEPTHSMTSIFILTLLLGFASATLDVVIDAYRIDTVEKSKLAAAAASAVFGYRIGGLIAGAGAFYIAHNYGWHCVFYFISVLYLLGIFFVLSLKEQGRNKPRIAIDIKTWKRIVIEPFIDFFQRKYSFTILLAIIFYKLGDAMLGVVATPFYMKLNFSLQEIAKIVKIYGFGATIFGAYLGGIIMYKYGNIRGLIICGIAQSITNLAFVWLNYQGHDLNALTITITVENIASGMGDAALIGYLSYLCNKHFSATQYAMLSSSSGLFSHSIVAFGGKIVQTIGWDLYFIMTSILACPGLLLLLLLHSKSK